MSSNQKTTVIVVDDDPSVGRALQLQLGILGFDAVILDSADKLLAGTTPTEDACLLLDVYMPEMNGIELSRRLAEAGAAFADYSDEWPRRQEDERAYAQGQTGRVSVQTVRSGDAAAGDWEGDPPAAKSLNDTRELAIEPCNARPHSYRFLRIAINLG